MRLRALFCELPFVRVLAPSALFSPFVPAVRCWRVRVGVLRRCCWCCCSLVWCVVVVVVAVVVGVVVGVVVVVVGL